MRPYMKAITHRAISLANMKSVNSMIANITLMEACNQWPNNR